MPAPRKLALTTSLFAAFALGSSCERVPTASPSASLEAGDPPEGSQPRADEESVAFVGGSAGDGGVLDPDPEQLAAGIPHPRFRIDVGDSPARGADDAPVTIVMFSDFECPYCDEGFHTVLDLLDEYPGQLRFVYKALPLPNHPHALEAALIGHSARAQGKFWEFHDLVFSGHGIDPETLEGYARQVGLDVARVARELDSLEHAPALRRDLRVAKRLELHSTPVFFVNGRMLPGARSKQVFRQLITEELALAERLAGDGVPAAEFYNYATQWGYTAIVYEDERPELDEDSVYPVPLGDSPSRGPADAPITIVAFSDFQCPFCARGHATMEQLRAIYGSKIRFVFKHFPLPGHPLGALASRASFAAAEHRKFWEFHDALFALGARYSADDIVAICDDLGIPRSSTEAAMTSNRNDGAIEDDIGLGIRLKVDGTPAYFINGRPLVGARPLIDFRMLIVEELDRVAAARAKGVPASEIYQHLVLDAAKSSTP